MDVRVFQKNRATFSREQLTQYQGCWVAFSADGRRIVASGATLDQVESQLAAQRDDPEQVFLEWIGGPEDDILLGGGDLG